MSSALTSTASAIRPSTRVINQALICLTDAQQLTYRVIGENARRNLIALTELDERVQYVRPRRCNPPSHRKHLHGLSGSGRCAVLQTWDALCAVLADAPGAYFQKAVRRHPGKTCGCLFLSSSHPVMVLPSFPCRDASFSVRASLFQVIKRTRLCIRVTRRLRCPMRSRPARFFVTDARLCWQVAVNPSQLHGDVIDGLLIQAVADGSKVSSTRMNAFIHRLHPPRHILEYMRPVAFGRGGRRVLARQVFCLRCAPDCWCVMRNAFPQGSV